MEVRTVLLAVVAILGFLSGLLGFIAEGKKLTESDITRLPADECVHGRGPALVLGMIAAVALLIAQIISNSLGGCICCESRASDPCGKSTPTAVAISFLTLSWITFSIAFLLLVAGASINDRRDASDNNLSAGCYVLKSGVFTGAAFASMTTVVLGIAYNLQVFSIRRSMGIVVDGGPNSSEVTTSNGNLRRSAMNSQEFMATARPVFSPEQTQKIKAVHDPRSAYPRSAIIPKREIGIREMTSTQSDEVCANDLQGYTRMRGSPANTELQNMQASKQTRKSLALQQQGYPSPDNEYYDEKEEGRYGYGSQHASQSASAAYNMNSRDASHVQYDNEQDALRPLYRRSGDGNAWDQ